jgi:hypothetical protein
MNGITNSAAYAAWYHTPRGRWIGEREFALREMWRNRLSGNARLGNKKRGLAGPNGGRGINV